MTAKDGTRYIAQGFGEQGLRLLHVLKQDRLKEGAILLSSGLDTVYPRGYPVARVSKVVSTPGEMFLTVSLEPIAHLSQAQQLLLVWPQKHLESMNNKT